MYAGHSSAALAVRAKWSLYHSHLPLSSDYSCGGGGGGGGLGSGGLCHRCCLPSSQLCGALAGSPRFIYYGYVLRRHSPAFFQLRPSRAALLVPRRSIRVCDYDGIDEVVGLLAERRPLCRCCGGDGFEREDGDIDERDWEDGARSRRRAVKGSYFSGDVECRGAWRRTGRADAEDDYDDESCGRGARSRRERRGFGRRIREEEENASSWKVPRHEKREESYDYEELIARTGRDSSSRRKVTELRSKIQHEDVDDRRSSGRRVRDKFAYDQQVGSQKLKWSSERKNMDRGESSISWQKEVDKQVVAQVDSARKSSAHVSNVESLTNSRRRLEEERMKGREERSSSVKDFVEVVRDEKTRDRKAVDKVGVDELYEKRASDSRFRTTDAERVESSKSYLDVRRDDKAVRDGRTQINQKAIDKVAVDEFYKTHASDSRFQISDTVRADSSKSYINVRRDDKVVRDKRTQIDQKAVDNAEAHYSGSSFQTNDTERAESSKSYLDVRRAEERQSSSLRHSKEERMKCREDVSTLVDNFVSERIDERIHVDQQTRYKMESNEQYGNQTNVNSSSVVDVVHGVKDSSRVESEWDSFASEFQRRNTENISNLQDLSARRSENQHVASSSVLLQDKKANSQRSNFTESKKIQMDTSESSLQGSSSTAHWGKSNAIESASRHDESSAVIMGDFVNKLRQEIATSDSSEINRDKAHKEMHHETSTVDLSMDVDIARHKEDYVEESGKQSSSRSAMKGPPDEMWDVKGMSSHEPSKIEEEPEKSPAAEVVDSNTSPGYAENAIARRSPRSLWTYIADIMKVGWARGSGIRSSSKKSGTRSLSNESIGSEAWFSGHEPDDNDDEAEKMQRDVSPEETMPSRKALLDTAERGQSSKPLSAAEDIEWREGRRRRKGQSFKGPPPAITIELSEGGQGRRESSTSASQEEVIEWDEGGSGRRDTLSSSTTIEQPLVQKESQKQNNSPKSEEEFGRKKQTETIGSGESYGELNKGNLSPKESRPEESNLGSSTLEEPIRTASSSKGFKTVSGTSSSKGFKTVSGTEAFESSTGERGQRDILSVSDRSPTLISGMVPPSITEIEITPIADSAMPKLEEVTYQQKQPEVGGTEGREWELKSRKFQRSDQVLKEQFGEWEEAYKRESEQRKVDEYFMREALLEAKKAADTWEVPVGAVLVHNGRIIARGCNLVEELRDSTSHAEMICIREASNLLRTWRLAETTLYVTLEPCPMCAGAILQARVDTVVWGAPNKLLGADGSWVRLFPTGSDGAGSSLDPSTAGPIHPFHPKITIRRGVLVTECADAMQQFFQLRRRKNKKQEQAPSPPPPCLPISTQPTKLLTRLHNIFSAMFCL